MLAFVFTSASLVFLALFILHWIWRQRQQRARTNWQTIYTTDSGRCHHFDPAAIRDLPQSVQRFLLYTIKPGTPLYHAAEIQMQGKFSFGPGPQLEVSADYNYLPLSARQLLRADTGMIWEATIGKGFKQLQGSDGLIADYSWTQFAWRNLIPVALMQRNPDHYRAAAGRMLAEAVFWTPTVLLTLPGVKWEAYGLQLIVATLTHRNLNLPITLRLNTEGQPTEVSFLRWSNANPDKTWRLQPFGGFLSQFREIGGVMIPTRVEAGNFFGTADYFPFYKVHVEQFHWLDAPVLD